MRCAIGWASARANLPHRSAAARRDVRRVAAEWRARLVGAEARLRHRVTTVRAAADARVREAVARLHALSPLAVLGRGYAVC